MDYKTVFEKACSHRIIVVDHDSYRGISTRLLCLMLAVSRRQFNFKIDTWVIDDAARYSLMESLKSYWNYDNIKTSLVNNVKIFDIPVLFTDGLHYGDHLNQIFEKTSIGYFENKKDLCLGVGDNNAILGIY